jgi:oxygen-independent coproporphyrinogen III oxidase
MSTLKVDLELIRKYNVAGPRYTSYPPATHFTDKIDPEAFLQKIRENNQTERDISLYFHLPFCYTLCWYCGCTTVITADQKKSGQYVDYLDREMELVQQLMNPKRKVVQMHFGGGTPTFSLPDEIRRLGDMIHSRFNFAEDVEAGVEVDPRRLTRDHLVALRAVGFNRGSLGVQDNDPVVQKTVHRIQPFEMTKQVVEWMREVGFQSINIDLIYGLPFQSTDSFARTLDETLSLRPDRFAVFNYAHVPWMKPAQKIIKQENLPSPELKLELLKLTIERLTSEGYVYIGMDHFARVDDELAVAQKQKTLQRNFQGYSTRGGTDIYAFGMSSISQAETFYWQNHKELPEYYASLDAGKLPLHRGYLMTPEDQIRRTTIMRLMCDLGLDYDAMTRLLGLNFREHFAPEIESLDDMEADGLLIKTPGEIVVTDLGRLLIRNIAMRFDAYAGTRKENRFSRTI